MVADGTFVEPVLWPCIPILCSEGNVLHVRCVHARLEDEDLALLQDGSSVVANSLRALLGGCR